MDAGASKNAFEPRINHLQGQICWSNLSTRIQFCLLPSASADYNFATMPEPVETLPCGHPLWLSSAPPIVFHANRMHAFWAKHKRFPIWNSYSVAIAVGMLLIVRLLAFISPLVSDIALAAVIFAAFLFVFIHWLLSRSSAVVED
jgi:hypothetical protein